MTRGPSALRVFGVAGSARRPFPAARGLTCAAIAAAALWAPAADAAPTPPGLAKLVSGRVGVAFGPPGRPPTVVGDLRSGPAWSTMKVPVAIAVSRRNGGTATNDMTAAITRSDNAAAMALWNSLGRPSRAGALSRRVLVDGGDRTTVVQTRVVRSGFTPFGQTDWSLAAQQTFAQHLPCVRRAAPVVRLMGQIDSSQRWGLGTVGRDQRFKAGWGPDTRGRYLVRQFGLIRVPSGTVAVAIAVMPADGQFATGVTEITRVAAWVAKNARGGRLAC